LNSAAALLVAGRAANLYDGVELAARAVDSGDAMHVLDGLVARTNTPAAVTETVG
jgi:anthranilate phosphoribosyltransferase